MPYPLALADRPLAHENRLLAHGLCPITLPVMLVLSQRRLSWLQCRRAYFAMKQALRGSD